MCGATLITAVGRFDEIRSYWNPDHSDPTLYCHLQELEETLLKLEIGRRKDVTKEAVLDELAKTRENFVRAEKEIDNND